MSTAPTHDELLAFALGKLPPDQVEAMSGRLEQFPAALAELQSIMESSDSLVEQVRQAVPAARYAAEPELRMAMENASGLIADDETIGVASRREATLTQDDSLTKATSAPQQLRDYRLLDKLGEGGMGAVYRAVHERLEKTVAVKILPEDRMRDPQVVARFHREMKAVGRLDHPNIIRATDAGEEQGTHYLVMEFVEGDDLAKIADRDGRLDVADACEIIRQAAVGLQHAHEHGLVHRDIKPSNMLLTRQGTVKLLDLGLARLLEEGSPAAGSELTSDGQLMGTVDYIAPEQASDTRTADIRADIYSLGCTLYKLLSGKPPFAGEQHRTPVQKIIAHTLHAPPALALARTDLPPGLPSIIERMMAKDRDARFATPGEVAAAIAPYCAGADLVGISGGASVPLVNPRSTAVGPCPAVSGHPDRPASLVPRPSITLPPRRWRRAGLVAVAASLPFIAFGIWLIVKDDQGNEVARVRLPDRATIHVEDEGKTTALPSNPSAPHTAEASAAVELPAVTQAPQAEKPFVVYRQGNIVRAFKSLGGALFDSKAGDVLEVHGNGPFELTGLEVIDKPLSLKAGAGYRPWFRVPRTIVVHNQPLEIEGCDFDCRDGQRLFEGSGATWEFRHCRFWNGAIGNLAGERIRFANCLAVGGHTFLYISRVARVEFDNCLMDIANGVVDADRDETHFSFKDSTFVLAGFGSPCAIKVNDAIKDRISIEATGNLFICDNSNWTGPVAGNDCLKKVEWKGRENIYAGGISYVPNEILKTLDDWNKLWGSQETDSHFIDKLPLEWSRASGMDWTDARDYFAPRVAAAGQKFKLDELGPDWNLVGPGEAYIKAREIASGQPIPPDELRLEVADGKPFVILRADKVAATFPTLHEAMAAVQDNDIVEIRMDGKVTGSTWEGKGRTLTVRAGLGYTPAVEHLQGVGDVLILEGLTFISTASATTSGNHEQGFVGEGSFLRVSNCSFANLCSGRFVGQDGQPAEISNCWIDFLSCGLNGNALRVRNSHLRTVFLDLPSEEESRLEFDRCTLLNPEPSAARHVNLTANVGRPKPALLVAMHRSYVVAPANFVHVSSLERVRWEGAGNVYSVPRNYPSGMDGDSLAAWQARFHSDATSFEELPTQFDPAKWRILADSPGYVRREDGRDFGADVDRILQADTAIPAE